ncbi:MAG: Rha family transcriptional regulator [Butyricicoccus sp.]
MNQLTILTQGNQQVVDSREVAEMVGKQHKDLMRSIREYSTTIEKSTERNFALSDFFLESSYKDSTGRELPCYLLTRKGCDMVANKMTGEKGVLFTAAYVTAFEQMREHIRSCKTKQELEATDKRATAMLLNSKTRVANQLMSLWSKAGVSAAHQALALSELYAEDGVHLAAIALQHTPVTYDKSAIAKKLGVLSKSGLPHAQAIGAIIRTLELTADEIECVPYVRNGHDGVDEQYTESVIDKVRAWLSERGQPPVICVENKSYNVVYRTACVS